MDLHVRSEPRNHYYPEHGNSLKPAYPEEYPEDVVIFKHLTGGVASIADSPTARDGLCQMARLHGIQVTLIEMETKKS